MIGGIICVTTLALVVYGNAKWLRGYSRGDCRCGAPRGRREMVDTGASWLITCGGCNARITEVFRVDTPPTTE